MHAAPIAVAVLAATLVAGGDDKRTVSVHALPADELDVAAPTVTDLDAGDVLTVHVDDGVAGARGTVMQCRRTASGYRGCDNHFPMLFDDDGRATFQYQLVDLDGCGLTVACVVHVRDLDGEREAIAFTVFGAADAGVPQVTLSPPGPYDVGDEVRVDVRSVPPGSEIQTAFCGPDCRSGSRTVAADDGTGTSSVVIDARCDLCRIVVVGAGGTSLTPVALVPPPSADYEAARLIAGLVAAVVFLLLAWRIVAAVDWRPPSEAQTPEMDRSELV